MNWKTYGKKKKKKGLQIGRKTRGFHRVLVKRAGGLQNQKKISDVWFQNLWVESGMHIPEGPNRDQFNAVFGYYIPDCANFFYRYVIEVDDPSHLRPEAKKRDKEKDKFYRESGYEVFRILSHNYEQFLQLKQHIASIRAAKQ